MADTPGQIPNSDIDERHSALRSNAAAIRTIASAVEGTLGPKGLDCMLVDRFNAVTITNDGAAILGKIDAQHPASRLLIHAAQAQDEAVGDGTTTATVLAAAMVEEGVAHILRGVPPTKVAEGLRAGVDAAVGHMEQTATRVSGLEDPLLLAAARVSARGNDEWASLAAEAARLVPEERLLGDPAFKLSKRVVAKEGADSRVVPGLVIDKERMNRQMPQQVCDAPVLVVADALEPEKLDEEALATEVGFQRHEALRQEFAETVERIIDLGVKLIAVERSVDPAAEALLTDAGAMVLRRMTRRDLAAILEHCGGKAVMRTGLRRDAEEIRAVLGHAECVEEDERLGQTIITGGSGAPTATIVIGAGTAEIRDERLRIAEDAASAVQAVARGGVLPGGGAAEVGAVPAVLEAKSRVNGMATYGVDAVAAALRAPLWQIITNAGFNPLEKGEDVIAAQVATGSRSLAMDCDTGDVVDMLEAGVVDPALVKVSALRTAAEIAEAVLRISIVIRMRDAEPAGQ